MMKIRQSYQKMIVCINSFSAIFMKLTSIGIKKQSMESQKDFNLKSLTKQADGIDQRSDCTFCAV